MIYSAAQLQECLINLLTYYGRALPPSDDARIIITSKSPVVLTISVLVFQGALVLAPPSLLSILKTPAVFFHHQCYPMLADSTQSYNHCSIHDIPGLVFRHQNCTEDLATVNLTILTDCRLR